MAGIGERILNTQKEIESHGMSEVEKPTARHTVYWRPSELEGVRAFGTENFLTIAETIRGGMRWILADPGRREALLEFLKEERRREAGRKA